MRKLIVSFCLEFLNCHAHMELSRFKEFEHTCCVHWIIKSTLWRLAGIGLLISFLFSIWRIEIGGI